MRFFAIAIVLSLLVLAPMGLAQQTQQQTVARSAHPSADQAAPPTFSEQDKVAAKKELQKVGELFGVNPRKNEPPPASEKKQETPVTMAEVADKALIMVGNAVGTIAGIVQKVAPEVWEIMVRQQYAKAIAGIIVPSGLLLLIWVPALVTKRFWPYDKSEHYFKDKGDQCTNKGTRAGWTTLFPTILTVFCGVWFFNRLADSALYLINPKYYAVKDLLEMLLK